MLHNPRTRVNSNGSLTVEFDEELNPHVAKALIGAKVTDQAIKVTGPMVHVTLTVGKPAAKPVAPKK